MEAPLFLWWVIYLETLVGIVICIFAESAFFIICNWGGVGAWQLLGACGRCGAQSVWQEVFCGDVVTCCDWLVFANQSLVTQFVDER